MGTTRIWPPTARTLSAGVPLLPDTHTVDIIVNQANLVARICGRPPNYAWFLGAGASRSAGLPTASDIIWDLKRRHYCRQENQDVSKQDLHNDAVRERVQSYFDSKGFPRLYDDDEYTVYFEKIFGSDRERQREYIKAILSEKRLSLSVGNRVFGALMAAGLSRIAFTTNFDSVVEKAVADMGSQSLSAYHLEGAHNANASLNNEEFPLYCKLHGDFRYDSLKNLSHDLEHQNQDLSNCLVNAGSRFGFIVCGYSGRDASVMQLFHRVLELPNPFPHGLYWTIMKGSTTPPSVAGLLDQAASKGVEAQIVETQTFDAFMLHLWRNIENRSDDLDAKVRKSRLATVDIPLPPPGRHAPLVRLTGLPILSIPNRCHSLSLAKPKEWQDLRRTMNDSKGGLILAKTDSIRAWGTRQRVREAFGTDLSSIGETHMPTEIRAQENHHLKAFLERALSLSLVKDRPLLTRTRGATAYVIADPRSPSRADLQPLSNVVGKTDGLVPGVSAEPTPDRPVAEDVRWAEALRISVNERNGRLWMLIHPDLWIWPPRSRKDAKDFMDHRRRDRLNRKYNELLDAWLRVVLGQHQRRSEIQLSPFDTGDDVENPQFRLSSRTAFSRKSSS